jgi:hypothetical protein
LTKILWLLLGIALIFVVVWFFILPVLMPAA